VIVHGTNRLGRATAVTLEGESLARHLLPRARKGAFVTPKLKVAGVTAAE
jgi:hypothetical protein